MARLQALTPLFVVKPRSEPQDASVQSGGRSLAATVASTRPLPPPKLTLVLLQRTRKRSSSGTSAALHALPAFAIACSWTSSRACSDSPRELIACGRRHRAQSLPRNPKVQYNIMKTPFGVIWCLACAVSHHMISSVLSYYHTPHHISSSSWCRARTKSLSPRGDVRLRVPGHATPRRDE